MSCYRLLFSISSLNLSCGESSSKFLCITIIWSILLVSIIICANVVVYDLVYDLYFSTVLHGKVMRKVGIEVVGMGALKLTGFLREQMQQQNISFESLYTVRELKEVIITV